MNRLTTSIALPRTTPVQGHGPLVPACAAMKEHWIECCVIDTLARLSRAIRSHSRPQDHQKPIFLHLHENSAQLTTRRYQHYFAPPYDKGVIPASQLVTPAHSQAYQVTYYWALF